MRCGDEILELSDVMAYCHQASMRVRLSPRGTRVWRVPCNAFSIVRTDTTMPQVPGRLLATFRVNSHSVRKPLTNRIGGIPPTAVGAWPPSPYGTARPPADTPAHPPGPLAPPTPAPPL
ncbi:hypothetical protein Misp01_72970 [Microtetraspora sp. NBRC 13810]|nr:hypothetical protein Misp01_72970 [Microtetraspora sp. NBRC 13810]